MTGEHKESKSVCGVVDQAKALAIHQLARLQGSRPAQLAKESFESTVDSIDFSAPTIQTQRLFRQGLAFYGGSPRKYAEFENTLDPYSSLSDPAMCVYPSDRPPCCAVWRADDYIIAPFHDDLAHHTHSFAFYPCQIFRSSHVDPAPIQLWATADYIVPAGAKYLLYYTRNVHFCIRDRNGRSCGTITARLCILRFPGGITPVQVVVNSSAQFSDNAFFDNYSYTPWNNASGFGIAPNDVIRVGVAAKFETINFPYEDHFYLFTFDPAIATV